MDNTIGNVLTGLKNEICSIMVRIQANENYAIICNQYEGYNKSMLNFICLRNPLFFETLFGKIYNYLINPSHSKQELSYLLTTELFYNRYLNNYIVDNVYDAIDNNNKYQINKMMI
jgi:hypothetical protein